MEIDRRTEGGRGERKEGYIEGEEKRKEVKRKTKGGK